MSISLVAGLGNPGREYEATRHNVGWIVVEAFARRHGLAWKHQAKFEAQVARWDRPGLPPCHLIKPLTFMNESGRSVAAMARFYKLLPSAVVAVYDDLNIELGSVKVSATGSAGGHNGVASLLGDLGEGFVRFRIGIGPRQPAEMDLKDFVLGNFSSDQTNLIQSKLPDYIDGLELLLNSGAAKAMNQLNRRNKNEP
jgi:PTH1 family peptidyl-tRNA hydrolase